MKTSKSKVGEKEEKVYTFRHSRWAVALDDGKVTEKQLVDDMVETALSKGYWPVQIKVQRIKANSMDEYQIPVMNYLSVEPPKDFLYAHCITAYAGKKMARELWKKEPFKELPTKISLNP